MNTAFASNLWPVIAQRDAGWRFGREWASPRGRVWRFELKRNVSMTPRQMLLSYGLLCALSLVVALGFWWQGVAMVVMFTGIELLAVGAAMLIVARHAGDRETITLAGHELAVEQHCGAQVECAKFRAEWVRIEPAGAEGSLVELSGQRRSVKVGRHVRPELRIELAQELRRALRLTHGDLSHGRTEPHDLDHELKA